MVLYILVQGEMAQRGANPTALDKALSSSSRLFTSTIYQVVPYGKVLPGESVRTRDAPLMRVLHALSLLQRTDESTSFTVLRIPIPHPEVNYVRDTIAESQRMGSQEDVDVERLQQNQQSCELTLALSSPYIYSNIHLRRFCTHERAYKFADKKPEARTLRAWRDIPVVDHRVGIQALDSDFEQLRTDLEGLTGAVEENYKLFSAPPNDEEDMQDEDGVSDASSANMMIPELQQAFTALRKTYKNMWMGRELGHRVRDVRNVIFPNEISEHLRCVSADYPASAAIVEKRLFSLPTVSPLAPFNGVVSGNAQTAPIISTVGSQWHLALLGQPQHEESSALSRSITQVCINTLFYSFRHIFTDEHSFHHLLPLLLF